MIRSVILLRWVAYATLALVGLKASGSTSITVDTPTQFAGTFSLTGLGASEAFGPSHFEELPFDDRVLLLERFATSTGAKDLFGCIGTGSPNNPTAGMTDQRSLPSIFGTYTNGGSGQDQTVNWSLTAFQDSDPRDPNGTFSGSFSFNWVRTSVPEPVETTAAIGLALGAFAFIRRGRRQAVTGAFRRAFCSGDGK